MKNDKEYMPAPKWMKEFSKAECHIFGDLAVCIRGTESYPTALGFEAGRKYANKVKICFGRLSKPDEYFCIRVIAEPDKINIDKGAILDAVLTEIINPDWEEKKKEGKNILGFVDNPMKIYMALDRTHGKDKDYVYYESWDWETGDTVSLHIKTVEGGRGRVKRVSWKEFERI